jgi:trk system potassium uptake protein TrkH
VSSQETIFGTAPEPQQVGFLDAFFLTVSSRTAGFSTIDLGRITDPSLIVLAITMFIGGSPVSTAGGIKTVTLAILVLAAVSVIKKRPDLEVYGRSVRLFVIGRAMTIVLLFFAVLVTVTLALCITERHGGFTIEQLFFETASALSNSGLSTGITSALTVKGKIYIILTMLIGRFSALALLASLTTSLKPARYNYPEEALVVG